MLKRQNTTFFLILAVLLFLSQNAWCQFTWSNDLETAKVDAKQSKKDLLIYFSSQQDCEPCRDLEQTILTTEAFNSAVQDDFVGVKINVAGADSNSNEVNPIVQTFAQKYGFKDTPTLFLADKQGRPYGRIDEPVKDVETFLERLSFERKNQPLKDVGDQWLDNYEMAKAKAAAQDKHLLLLFTGSDWCPGCIMMEKNIFSKPEFKNLIGKDFVLMKFDFPRRRSLPAAVKQQNEKTQDYFVKNYNFRGYPTVYLAYPDGSPYASVGPVNMEPKAYAEMLIKGRQQELESAQ